MRNFHISTHICYLRAAPLHMLQVLKHLQSPPLPVAFLLLLHQYCRIWCNCNLHNCQNVSEHQVWRFYSQLKLRHVNFWAFEYYSTVVGVLSMCQLMTSSHTVIVHPLLVFLEYGWCDLITPVLLVWYSDLNQVSISGYSSVVTHTHIAALPLSAVDVCCWFVNLVYTTSTLERAVQFVTHWQHIMLQCSLT